MRVRTAACDGNDTDRRGARAVVASHTLHRFLLQRQPAKEFLKYFLDLHMSTAQQARRPGPMHSPGQWPRLL